MSLPVRSADPLQAAVTAQLWPVLREAGFIKVSPRVFARARNNVLHRIIVDATGVNGRGSTHIVYDAELLCYPNISGWMLGDRMRGGSWDMSNHACAESSMREAVQEIKADVLPWLDAHSDAASILNGYLSKRYQPLEPLLFGRAVAKAATGDTHGAKDLLSRVLSGTFQAWTASGGPAELLNQAISTGATPTLLRSWEDENLARFKLCPAGA